MTDNTDSIMEQGATGQVGCNHLLRWFGMQFDYFYFLFPASWWITHYYLWSQWLELVYTEATVKKDTQELLGLPGCNIVEYMGCSCDILARSTSSCLSGSHWRNELCMAVYWPLAPLIAMMAKVYLYARTKLNYFQLNNKSFFTWLSYLWLTFHVRIRF